jgi:hypothetical protein
VETPLLFAAFAAAAIAFGATVGARMKGGVATRVIAGSIATFAAFVFFYKIVMPVVGWWTGQSVG